MEYIFSYLQENRKKKITSKNMRCKALTCQVRDVYEDPYKPHLYALNYKY